MKELEVTIRVRNNRLRERRLALGLSLAEVGERAGVSATTLCAYENLKRSPVGARGQWKSSADRLAIFYRVPTAEVFPECVLAITEPVAVRRVDVAELALLSASAEPPALPSEVVEHGELRDLVTAALSDLPELDARVLELRFGVGDEGGGGGEKTLEEVAEHFGFRRERVRQIEARALRTLRHPGIVRRHGLRSAAGEDRGGPR